MEKEQAQTVKSIAGIMKAIEMGVVTETTKSRLEELERRKRELDEEIAIAKANRPDDVTKDMIIQYIRYAFKQPQQLLFDLLIEKITIFEDRIVLTIKTFGSTSPDGGKRKYITRYTKSPDLNDRGSFYMSVICREPFDHAAVRPSDARAAQRGAQGGPSARLSPTSCTQRRAIAWICPSELLSCIRLRLAQPYPSHTRGYSSCRGARLPGSFWPGGERG